MQICLLAPTQKRELNFENRIVIVIITGMVTTLSVPVLKYLSMRQLISRLYYPILQAQRGQVPGSTSHSKKAESGFQSRALDQHKLGKPCPHLYSALLLFFDHYDNGFLFWI